MDLAELMEMLLSDGIGCERDILQPDLTNNADESSKSLTN